MLHIQLLGSFRVSAGDSHLAAIYSPRLQELFVYLLLRRSSPQPRALLAYTLWPDSSEEQARTNLRRLFYDLRHTFPYVADYFEAGVHTMQWRLDAPFSLDVDRFEKGCAQADLAARAQDPAAASIALEQAIREYSGDLLPGSYTDWIIPERERLRQMFLVGLDRLATLRETSGEYAEAIHFVQKLLTNDPYQEAAYRKLIRLHVLNGERAEAQRVFQTCTDRLLDDLGVNPSPLTLSVYKEFVESGSEHQAGKKKVSLTFESRSTIAAAARSNGGAQNRADLMPRDDLGWMFHRSAWERLQDTWAKASAGRPQLALILGDAGSGKTHVAGELFAWAARQGARTALASAYPAEGTLPFAPLENWLRRLPPQQLDPAWQMEVDALFPGLQTGGVYVLPDPTRTLRQENSQRLRRFKALVQALLRPVQPLLLVLDDLQWCDQDTLEWLHFALRYEATFPLLVAATCRWETSLQPPALTVLLSSLRQHAQVSDVFLKPLDETQTAILAEQVRGQPLDAQLAARLYTETEGRPLCVVETLRSGWPEGEAGLPPVAAARLAELFAPLSAAARELLGLMAAAGGRISFHLLEAASALKMEALLDALDELAAGRILLEDPPDGLRFAHPMLQRLALAQLNTARRSAYQRRLARGQEMQ